MKEPDAKAFGDFHYVRRTKNDDPLRDTIGEMEFLALPWYVYALGGAAVVAISSILEKDVLKHEEPAHFSSAVAFVGAIISIPFLIVAPWSTLTFLELSAIYVISFLSIGAWFSVAYAVKRLDVGEVSALLAVVPAATAVLAYILLGEALLPLQVMGLLAVVGGLLVLEAPHLRGVLMKVRNRSHTLGVIFILLAISLYAIGSIVDRVVLSRFLVDPITFVALAQAMSFANALVLESVLTKRAPTFLTLFKSAPLRTTTIGVLVSLSRVMHAQAIALAFVALAGALKRTGALFTIVLATIFLKEKGSIRKLCAAGLILAGVCALILS